MFLTWASAFTCGQFVKHSKLLIARCIFMYGAVYSISKRPINWLGQIKRCATKIRSKNRWRWHFWPLFRTVINADRKWPHIRYGWRVNRHGFYVQFGDSRSNHSWDIWAGAAHFVMDERRCRSTEVWLDVRQKRHSAFWLKSRLSMFVTKWSYQPLHGLVTSSLPI